MLIEWSILLVSYCSSCLGLAISDTTLFLAIGSNAPLSRHSSASAFIVAIELLTLASSKSLFDEPALFGLLFWHILLFRDAVRPTKE